MNYRNTLLAAALCAAGINMSVAQDSVSAPAPLLPAERGDTIVIARVTSKNRSLVDRQIDRLMKSNKVIFIDGKTTDDEKQQYIDSIRREMGTFYYDQFRHYDDPAAPYFLFMSRNAGLTMGIGGVARFRAYYDWGGAIPSSAFAPYLIPIPASPTDVRQFGATPSGCCLYFRVLGRNKVFGKYQIYLEADFTGYQGRDFRLKKAYAQFRDFTIGYAPSTFSDPSAIVPMVDANGPASKIAPVNVLFRYMPTVKKKWLFAVSAECSMAGTNYNLTDSATAKVRSWLPDFDAFAQFQWADGQHVRLSAMYHNMTYRNLREDKNRNVAGWGLQLSSVAHPFRPLTTYVTLCYGRGYTNLMSDMMIGNYDLVPNPDRPGTMYSPYSYGWSVGLQYNFLPNLYSCVTMSQTRYLPNRAVESDEYKYGQLLLSTSSGIPLRAP